MNQIETNSKCCNSLTKQRGEVTMKMIKYEKIKAILQIVDKPRKLF